MEMEIDQENWKKFHHKAVPNMRNSILRLSSAEEQEHQAIATYDHAASRLKKKNNQKALYDKI